MGKEQQQARCNLIVIIAELLNISYDTCEEAIVRMEIQRWVNYDEKPLAEWLKQLTQAQA